MSTSNRPAFPGERAAISMGKLAALRAALPRILLLVGFAAAGVFIYLRAAPNVGDDFWAFALALAIPGLGLGVILSEAHQVSDSMFLAAARTLAACVSPDDFASGSMYPAQSRLREVSREIACAVMIEARRLNLGKRLNDEQIRAAVVSAMWDPSYEHEKVPALE